LETPLTIRFDAADHDWLLAYTHLLSGFGNAFLAFDPTPVIQHLSHQQALLAKAPKNEYAYDLETITAEIVDLKALQYQIKAKIEALSAADLTVLPPLNDAPLLERQRLATERDANNSELHELRRSERLLRAEIRSAEAKLPDGNQQRRRRDFLSQSTLDTFYIVIAALRQHPDPDHVRAAQQDWRAMITRQSWRSFNRLTRGNAGGFALLLN